MSYQEIDKTCSESQDDPKNQIELHLDLFQKYPSQDREEDI